MASQGSLGGKGELWLGRRGGCEQRPLLQAAAAHAASGSCTCCGLLLLRSLAAAALLPLALKAVRRGIRHERHVRRGHGAFQHGMLAGQGAT